MGDQRAAWMAAFGASARNALQDLRLFLSGQQGTLAGLSFGGTSEAEVRLWLTMFHAPRKQLPTLVRTSPRTQGGLSGGQGQRMEAHAHAEVAAEGFRAHAKPLAAQMLRASCRHRFVKCAFGVPQGHAGRASAHPKASQEVGEGSQKLDFLVGIGTKGKERPPQYSFDHSDKQGGAPAQPPIPPNTHTHN